MELNHRKIINAWCIFDWANSVYSLVVTATIFPIYYNAITTKAFGGTQVKFFGFPIENSVLLTYSLSASFLLLVFLLPLLSGIADYSGKKKSFMRLFTTLGSIACMGLFFFTGENVEWAIGCSMLASIGFAGSIVFYNAYLPEIVTPDRYDMVSAKGFAMGYAGSVLLLIFNILMSMKPELFGFGQEARNASLHVRVAFLLVGVWWLGFSQITFYHLPNRKVDVNPEVNLFSQGFKELRKVGNQLLQQSNTMKFLASFFFYNAGVQTVLLVASIFAAKELKMESTGLITTILLLQIVALGGAYLFAKVSELKGNKVALMIILFIWILDTVAAYFVQSEMQFYLLAAGVGMVMGGVQSLSRATYCKLFPEDTKDTASYFSFYDVLDKLSTFMGTLVYGVIEQVTGNLRYSILALALFFVLGLVFMSLLKIQRPKLQYNEH